MVFGFGLAAATPGQAVQGPGGAAKMAPGAMAAGTQESAMPAPDNPVADPKAVVTIGNARFTVLTPQLIRMEWSADGKFEDHASLVFINRRLPVPKFWSSASSVAGNDHISDNPYGYADTHV